MELSSLSTNIVTIPYEHNGDTTNLDVNIDIFTPEFFRLVGKRFADKVKEWEDKVEKEAKQKRAQPAPKPNNATDKKANEARNALAFFEDEAISLEVSRQIHAELLAGGVLKGWDVTRDGLPIAPSYEVLMKLPPLVVEEIWKLALERAQTVKKKVVGVTEETLENTPSGSREPLKLAPTG